MTLKHKVHHPRGGALDVIATKQDGTILFKTLCGLEVFPQMIDNSGVTCHPCRVEYMKLHRGEQHTSKAKDVLRLWK